MKRILIMNGPNLNLLGKRETEIYGVHDFKSYLEKLRERYPDVRLDFFQSNMEGALIDKLHEAGFGKCDGINGDVDVDYCYRDYPALIREKHLNGY